jgi:hypothetical protein
MMLNKKEFFNACRTGDIELIKNFVALGFDFKIDSCEALMLSAKNGHIEVVKYLINLGCDINCRYGGALERSAIGGHLTVVKYLIEAGCRIAKNNSWPLCLAAEFNRKDIVEYLISIGCDIESNNNYPLKRCIHFNMFEIAKYLVSMGSGIQHDNYKILEYSAPKCTKMHLFLLSVCDKRVYSFSKNKRYRLEHMLLARSKKILTERIVRKNNLLKLILKPKSLCMQMHFI